MFLEIVGVMCSSSSISFGGWGPFGLLTLSPRPPGAEVNIYFQISFQSNQFWVVSWDLRNMDCALETFKAHLEVQCPPFLPP